MTSLSVSKVFNPNAGWYRGDFHAHTTASWDGHHAPAGLADVARAGGLDFFAVTDHNTIAAFNESAGVEAALSIPGLEVTTRLGHMNVFGMTGPCDWMAGILGNEEWETLPAPHTGINALVRRIAAQGLVSSINHPLLTPWAWQFNDLEWQYITALEIWNDPSFPINQTVNPQAVALWTALLNAGWRITALGGSDYHRPAPHAWEGDKPAEQLNRPTTFVYADNLSAAAVLKAVKQHRVYVSMGAEVDLTARSGGQTFGIGQEIPHPEAEITLQATIAAGPEPAEAQLIHNGQIVARHAIAATPAAFRHTLPPSTGNAGWVRLDVAGGDGHMAAITNPIFIGPAQTPSLQTYGESLAVIGDRQLEIGISTRSSPISK